jgi:hypothetical protein
MSIEIIMYPPALGFSPLSNPFLRGLLTPKGDLMKKMIILALASASLFVGCAHRTYYGGTGSGSETTTGSSIQDRPRVVNDMDDLGYAPTYNNQKPNGQPRVPGHSVDIDTH